MPMNWNVNFAARELIIIMYFAAWLLYSSNKVNKATVMTFFVLSIVDALLYFYNYKLGGFGLVYYWFAGVWILIFNWKQIAKWKG